MAYMSHNKHYTTGDAPPPPPAQGVLRVYGMKFCPFVHRLKLVMHAVGADDHETINCNTVHKPEWLFERNPRGKVPVIERDNDIIYESDITSRYINSCYGGSKQLITQDPLQRAKEEVLLGDLDKAISGFFVYGRAKDDEGRSKGTAMMVESFKSLEKFLCATKQPYIGGSQPGMSDFMHWPFLQRIAVRHRDLLSKNSTVNGYYERMLTNESVIACKHPDSLEAQFWVGYFAGTPVYDIFAEKEASL